MVTCQCFVCTLFKQDGRDDQWEVLEQVVAEPVAPKQAVHVRPGTSQTPGKDLKLKAGVQGNDTAPAPDAGIETAVDSRQEPPVIAKASSHTKVLRSCASH